MHTESSVTNSDKSPCHRALGAAQKPHHFKFPSALEGLSGYVYIF